MATSFPGSVTSFTEPSLPEETVLAQAGSGSRNHFEHHRDLGDTVEALQTHAALKGHDHSGDAGDHAKGPKLKQSVTHEDVDTDLSHGALHHTIGTGPNQAAAGNHTHNYDDLPGLPYKRCTSGTRPGMPTAGMMIYETDTKCFRHWERYDNNQVITGLDSTVYFTTALADGVGGTGWSTPTYTSGDLTHGIMVTPDGTLQWSDDFDFAGSPTNIGWMRRTNPLDAVTQSDDQVITWKTGTQVIEDEPLFTDGATNDFYFRVSSDEQSYVKLRVGYTYVKVFYTTSGRANEKHLGTLDNITTNLAQTEWRGQLVDRTFTLFRMGEPLGQIRDTKNVTAKSANHRGWMVGMQAGERGWVQTTPADIEWVRIQDMKYYASANRWTLLNIGQVPRVRLRQSKAQQLLNGGTIIEWATEVEDNFGYFNKNVSQTDINIIEPGRHRLDVGIQWDPALVPDIAHVIVMLNGAETVYRDSKFIRGNGYQPGFSQNMTLSIPLTLAAGDVLQIKVKYTASPGLLNQIFSWFDFTSNVNSRLELTYEGP